jgi:hypothetical protein
VTRQSSIRRSFSFFAALMISRTRSVHLGSKRWPGHFSLGQLCRSQRRLLRDGHLSLHGPRACRRVLGHSSGRWRSPAEQPVEAGIRASTAGARASRSVRLHDKLSERTCNPIGHHLSHPRCSSRESPWLPTLQSLLPEPGDLACDRCRHQPHLSRCPLSDRCARRLVCWCRVGRILLEHFQLARRSRPYRATQKLTWPEGPLLCQQLILSGPGSPGALAAPANILSAKQLMGGHQTHGCIASSYASRHPQFVIRAGTTAPVS